MDVVSHDRDGMKRRRGQPHKYPIEQFSSAVAPNLNDWPAKMPRRKSRATPHCGGTERTETATPIIHQICEAIR